jgi:hypothetical protein
MMARNFGKLFVAAAAAKHFYGVVGNSLKHLRSELRLVVWIFAFVCSMVSPLHAQQTEELQKQLRELKHQYEQTTLELQGRIAALEEQIKKSNEAKENPRGKEGVVSGALQDAAQAALGQSSQKEQPLQGQLPSAPTYDLLRDADTKIEKLEEQVRSFEFHGYLRSGYGLNLLPAATVETVTGTKIPVEFEAFDFLFQLPDLCIRISQKIICRRRRHLSLKCLLLLILSQGNLLGLLRGKLYRRHSAPFFLWALFAFVLFFYLLLQCSNSLLQF